MSDIYASHLPTLSDPATDAFPVTPGPAPLARPCRALYIATGGTITVTTLAGRSVALTVPDGFLLPLRCTHVTAAVTAAGIVALV